MLLLFGSNVTFNFGSDGIDYLEKMEQIMLIWRKKIKYDMIEPNTIIDGGKLKKQKKNF